MKKIFYPVTLLILLAFAANAQTKRMELKNKNNFMQRFHQFQNFNNQNQSFGLTINPYWESINAPHTYNSYLQNVKVPAYNCVWATVYYDSVFYFANSFIRTADGGKTWRYDSVDAPAGYGLNSIAPVDGNTCYAALSAINSTGGGIFKTTDGGDTWKQLEKGKLFNSTSVLDFVYFFDAQHGLAVGDNNGDTSVLEIYTTSDAGKNWSRVPNQNIPPTIGSAYSFSGSVYTVFKNTLWFQGYDSYGNGYIYRSDDLGNHWQLFPYTLSTPIFDFVFTDKLNGLGVSFNFGEGPNEVETHDGGKTWNNKNFTGPLMGGWITQIPYTHTLVSTLPGPGLTPVYGSSYSNDYGASWHLIDSGINALHTEAHFLSPFYGWSGRSESADPNGGTYKWKLQFSLDDNAANKDASISSITKIDASNTVNARLYPNPAKDVITVNGLSTSAKTTLSLFTMSGRLLQQSTTAAESYTYSLQNLAAGTYYIKIQSGEKATTLKFVKQ